MKPYGHRARDHRTCEYGCCGPNKSNVANQKPIKRLRVNRAAKKRARRFSVEKES